MLLPRFFFQQIGVFVGNFDGEFVDQFLRTFKHRSCVSKFRKDNQSHRKKRRGPSDRRIDHRQHAIGVRAHLFALDWICQVRLATSD